MRHLLHPFEIALQRSTDARPELRRSAPAADGAAVALDQEVEHLRQQQISGEPVLIEHDHAQIILQRRQLPAVERQVTHLPD